MKKIAPDKWKHFWVGIPLGIVLQLAGNYYFTQPLGAMLFALIILIIICYGFELFSLITKLGHHDLLDAVAGILGGVVGICLVVILKLLRLC
jgi:glycopeptide antibiotics resistance protein